MTSFDNNSFQDNSFVTFDEPAPQPYFPKGKAITCMIMGIVSVAIGWYPIIFSIPCIVFGIVALVLANGCAGAPAKYAGMIKAGRITGVIGLILSSLMTFLPFFIAIAASM